MDGAEIERLATSVFRGEDREESAARLSKGGVATVKAAFLAWRRALPEGRDFRDSVAAYPELAMIEPLEAYLKKRTKDPVRTRIAERALERILRRT